MTSPHTTVRRADLRHPPATAADGPPVSSTPVSARHLSWAAAFARCSALWPSSSRRAFRGADPASSAQGNE